MLYLMVISSDKRVLASAAILATGLLVSGLSWAGHRKSDDDGFPDYNHLEYAKPLPPPDQQVAPPKPGSFHMTVGKEEESVRVPLEALPVPLAHTAARPDESEPPLANIMDDSQPAVSSASSHATMPSAALPTTLR